MLKDQIFAVLDPIYTNYYGEHSVRKLSGLISDRINMGDVETVPALRNMIWMWHSGGTTAELAAEQIAGALPEYFGGTSG